MNDNFKQKLNQFFFFKSFGYLSIFTLMLINDDDNIHHHHNDIDNNVNKSENLNKINIIMTIDRKVL